MRIVFFGTPELAVPSLEAISGVHEIAAAVCQPDRPAGRGKKLVAPPVKTWAKEHGITVHQPTKLNDGAFEAWLRERRPEVCALVAYGRILKQPVLDVPTHGFLNVHPSMLPLYRGPSPIQTAILDGRTETGVTIMRLDAGMDTGDTLIQQSLDIDPADTTKTLSEKAAELGAELLMEAIARIEANTAEFTPQDDARATVCTLFEKRDGQIQWNSTADEIRDLVRASIPWPVAHCLFDGATIRIHACELTEEASDQPPGTIVRIDDNAIVVATADTLLAVTRLQPPGKRAMDAADYLRGNAVRVGQRFEDL